MSEPITFFYQRQQDAGYTYAFDLESPTRVYGSSPRVYRIFVYSRAPVEESLVRSGKLLDYEQQMRALRQAVGPEGAIVWTYEQERMRSFQVVPVGAEGSIFKSYGVLRPGADLSLEEVKIDKWLQTPAGTHLLVPVDRGAEEHLRELKNYLAWLPRDLESLILYTIRRPSLDARVKDLEVKGRKASNTDLVSRIREWLVPILLAVILILNVALFWALRQNHGPAAAEHGTTSGTTSKQDDPGKKAEPGKPADHDQKVFAILQAVQEKAGKVKVFAGLRDGNFKGLANEQHVAVALNDAKRAQPLVLGLMKLEALRLDTDTASGLFSEPNNPTAVKDFFRDRSPDPAARDLLGALGCAAYKIPGFPVTRDGKSPALSFVEGEDCKSLTLDKATEGLEDLLDFVKQYSPGGDASGGAS